MILIIIPSPTNTKKSVEEPRIKVCDFGDIRCVLGHVIHVVEPMDPQGAGPHHGSVWCHLTLPLPPYTLCSLRRDKIAVIDLIWRAIDRANFTNNGLLHFLWNYADDVSLWKK